MIYAQSVIRMQYTTSIYNVVIYTHHNALHLHRKKYSDAILCAQNHRDAASRARSFHARIHYIYTMITVYYYVAV